MRSRSRPFTPSTIELDAGWRVELIDLKKQLNGDASRLIVVLAAAIAAVLLIGMYECGQPADGASVGTRL